MTWIITLFLLSVAACARNVPDLAEEGVSQNSPKPRGFERTMSDVVASQVSRVVGEVMINTSDVAKKGASVHDRVDDALLETAKRLKHMGRLVSKVGGAIKVAGRWLFQRYGILASKLDMFSRKKIFMIIGRIKLNRQLHECKFFCLCTKRLCIFNRFNAFAAPSPKKADVVNALDIVVDEESKSVGEEAQLVGKVLCDIAQGLKEASQNEAVPADEATEYFFKKIFRGARKVFRQVGKAGLEIGKRFLGQKAGELIRQKIRERTGRYALADDDSYQGLVLALSEDIDQLGKELIDRGVELNGGVVIKEEKWDADTEKFVKDCVELF
ncbi:unnamed protein product [Ixodes hexagonus]